MIHRSPKEKEREMFRVWTMITHKEQVEQNAVLTSRQPNKLSYSRTPHANCGTKESSTESHLIFRVLNASSPFWG